MGLIFKPELFIALVSLTAAELFASESPNTGFLKISPSIEILFVLT